MYDSLFCRMYNEFGWNEYPRAFGEQLLVLPVGSHDVAEHDAPLIGVILQLP